MLLLLKQKPLDQMWEEVKAYYEKSCRDKQGNQIRFKVRPSNEAVKMLWQKMQILDLEYKTHRESLR